MTQDADYIAPAVNIRKLAAAVVVYKQMGARSMVNALLRYVARRKVSCIAGNVPIFPASY